MSVLYNVKSRWTNALALRDHGALICIFVFVARCEGASVGGMPHGVQDRVPERQEGFLVANKCRRVCNEWPLVAALLLVLSLIVAARFSAQGEPRAASHHFSLGL